jgi:hypothetical protein
MNIFLLICFIWFIGWYLSCLIEYNDSKKIDTSSLFIQTFAWPLYIGIFILFYVCEFFYVYFPKVSPYLNPKKYPIMSFEFLNDLTGRF